ncbi:antiviral reverse transcriptase Drt2 [Rheinheimera sp.]|uniref:antiviral reverse transcriptase Drt2 n=1 Tax=Rheinheimera sp. TaxID=1869214 RepID=UPI002354D958|nr:antiviral reverse transcriptase Drt2 [Rheinheimera sp.]
MVKKHDWYRLRGYLHFDAPIGLKKANAIVTNTNRVATHAFYPLLHYTIESFKVFKNEQGAIEKKVKHRPIAYASHLDSHIYSYYSRVLSAKYEIALKDRGLEKNVIAFRALGKSNIDFANDAFEEIKKRRSCSAIALDITGFFDNLDHQILKEHWCYLLEEDKLPNDHFNVFRSITRFSKVCRDTVYERLKIAKNNPKNGRFKICEPEVFRRVIRANKLIQVNTDLKGVPQGSPISALLSNIYMLTFDVAAKNIAEQYDGCYYRYCDDMLFIVPTAYKDLVEKAVMAEIEKVKLDINPKKTEIRDFWPSGAVMQSSKPLQYLGFIFDGQHKLIRSAALARFSGRMKSGVRLAKKTQRKANYREIIAGKEVSRLFKHKLYERYSHLSSRNFITYGYRAAKIMQSQAIRTQLKPMWGRLQKEISDDNPLSNVTFSDLLFGTHKEQ